MIYQQNNKAAFAGNHKTYATLRPFIFTRYSATSAAAENELIEQARNVSRFTFTRLFGRVN